MEVIVLGSDSDDGNDTGRTVKRSTSFDASVRPRPAKRRRQEASMSRVSDTVAAVDLSDSVSHVSDTVQEPTATEAPACPASAAAGEAESPTLSPQQVRSRGFAYYCCGPAKHVLDILRALLT